MESVGAHDLAAETDHALRSRRSKPEADSCLPSLRSAAQNLDVVFAGSATIGALSGSPNSAVLFLMAARRVLPRALARDYVPKATHPAPLLGPPMHLARNLDKSSTVACPCNS